MDHVLFMLTRTSGGPRHEPRIDAVAWTSGAEPRLVFAESFRTEAELRVWLGCMKLRGLALTVKWTDELKADAPLREMLKEAFDPAL
jgi:hypothetical protein